MITRSPSSNLISQQDIETYHTRGYLIVKGLFTQEQITALRTFFDELGAAGVSIPRHWELGPEVTQASDPLQRYPRVKHPHRFNALCKDMMLHPGVGQVLQALLGEEPVACQSMYYFKPPGAKGQALHQDNFYLDVMPGSCIAAWVAIDHAQPDNGGLYVVPNTHTLDVQCPDEADPNLSFTTHLVNAPKGLKATPAILEPGDVLFFNGNVIHGSGPNRSKDQWRRSFICHYMPRSSKSISGGYRPVFDFNGQVVDEYEASPKGGPCGLEFKPSSYDKGSFEPNY